MITRYTQERCIPASEANRKLVEMERTACLDQIGYALLNQIVPGQKVSVLLEDLSKTDTTDPAGTILRMKYLLTVECPDPLPK